MNRINPDDTGSSLKRRRGRPTSAAASAARRAREKAANTGLLPHEIMLSIARGEPQKVWVRQEDGTLKSKEVAVETLDQIKDAAAKAAPFYAARLSAVDLIGSVSDDDLNEFIKNAAAEAGISLGDGGDGEAEEDEDEEAAQRGPHPDAGARRNRFV